MANNVNFEGKERRMAKIEKCLAEFGIASLEEARELCLSKGFDPDKIVKGVQPSRLKTRPGRIRSAVRLQSKRAQRMLRRRRKPLASALRHSAFPVPLRSRETLGSATETLAQCS